MKFSKISDIFKIEQYCIGVNGSIWCIFPFDKRTVEFMKINEKQNNAEIIKLLSCKTDNDLRRICMCYIDNYSQRKTKALILIKGVYGELKSGLITYKNFKSEVKRIMRRCGCKYAIDNSLYYVEIDNKKYYGISFYAGDFDLEFEIDANLIDLRAEKLNSIGDIKEGDFLHECFMKCLHKGEIINFDNNY